MPIQIKKLIYLNDKGLLNRTEDGAITNIGGTAQSSFTVNGIPVLLDDGSHGGGGTGNVLSHVHFQYAASAVWSIQHNRNSIHPVITVWNASLIQILPMQVQIVDANLVRVFFSSPMAGKATIAFDDESSVTIDGVEQVIPVPPNPPNPVFVNTINGEYGDVVLPPSISTDGYLQIPELVNAPTGTPTDLIPGFVPMVYENSNNKLWVFVNGSWKSTIFS